MNRRTPGEKLALLIQYGVDNGETIKRAMRLLNRIAPETMTQQAVAQRWPHILAAMIAESSGYFTPESAANALLSHKLQRPFGCEYYCALAGFERDGFPTDARTYDAKVRDAGDRQLRASVSCREFTNSYDACQDPLCHHARNMHLNPGSCLSCKPNEAFHAFVDRPPSHTYCRHKLNRVGAYEVALTLVRQLAEKGRSNTLFMSW